MTKPKQPSEFDILEVFTQEMDAKGVNRKFIQFDIDEKMAEKISMNYKSPMSIDEVKKLADKCLANEWLEHTTIGTGQYGHLNLTTTGVGVIRSRQRKNEMLSQRSFLKKTSDFIEDHKGIFIAIGSAIALTSLIIKLFTGGE